MEADVQLFLFFPENFYMIYWEMYTATFPVHIKFRIKRKAVPSCLQPRPPLPVLPFFSSPPLAELWSGIKWVVNEAWGTHFAVKCQICQLWLLMTSSEKLADRKEIACEVKHYLFLRGNSTAADVQT